jgi:hypothetical protein
MLVLRDELTEIARGEAHPQRYQSNLFATQEKEYRIIVRQDFVRKLTWMCGFCPDIRFSETTPDNQQKSDRALPSTHGALRFTTLLRCPLQRNRLTISLPLSRYHQPNLLRLGPSHFLFPIPAQTRALRFPNPIPLVNATPIITNVRSASADVYCRLPASMRG